MFAGDHEEAVDSLRWVPEGSLFRGTPEPDLRAGAAGPSNGAGFGSSGCSFWPCSRFWGQKILRVLEKLDRRDAYGDSMYARMRIERI